MKIPTLPPVQLQAAMQSAARCDMLLASEEWLRCFSYDANWADGIAMAKFDNGGGDHVFAFFAADGRVIIKGFDHESEVSPHAREEYGVWPGIYSGMPAELTRVLQDEAVEHEDVTFCCWSEDGVSWTTGNAQIPEGMDDGAEWLLDMVQMDASDFIDWAKSYYEDEFDTVGEEALFAEFSAHAEGTVQQG